MILVGRVCLGEYEVFIWGLFLYTEMVHGGVV